MRLALAVRDADAGQYIADIRVNPTYLDVFGIPPEDAATAVTINVRTITDPLLARSATAVEQATPRQVIRRPTGLPSVPKGTKPDLRPLPAWGVRIGEHLESDGRDHLSFSATVWTAGQSPLVVEGFRRAETDVMDAYQYFYDADGNQIGYTPVGTMEWDARDGHEHWHFTDFAQYRLLSEDGQLAVRSGKEAFCLANTDAIDYTIPRANWQPENTDLYTACGSQASLAVRQVLDVGSGDTYAQYLPGQSFDITDLPNGTYYIEIAANPDRRLHETDTRNNVSLRKVIIGGEPGARTAEVPPYDGTGT